MPDFNIIHKDSSSQARLGILHFEHGDIETPAFVPWGEKRMLGEATASELKFWGARAILIDAFELSRKPGDRVIMKAGGLHRYLGWTGPIISSSGQFFHDGQSGGRPSPTKSFESGVIYQGQGSVSILYTPEEAAQIQINLMPDAAIALGAPGGSKSGKTEQLNLADINLKWAKRSKNKFGKHKFAAKAKPWLWPVFRLGGDQQINQSAAADLAGLDFDGFAIEGEAVRKKSEVKRFQVIAKVLGEQRPKVFVEAGSPANIPPLVAAGVDLFSSDQPVALAGQGQAFCSRRPVGYVILNIIEKKYADDKTPLDSACVCYACRNYSRQDIYKLHLDADPLAIRLLLMHNFRFYFDLLENIRRAVRYGTFADYLKSFRQFSKLL